MLVTRWTKRLAQSITQFNHSQNLEHRERSKFDNELTIQDVQYDTDSDSRSLNNRLATSGFCRNVIMSVKCNDTNE